MRQRVADYIADYLADSGVSQVFSVVGGGAMHLNNAFGKCSRLNVLYNHHEQASAIAAESYSRIHNRMAAVCVTSGPGGTNALTGVLCAYQDSLPMIVISGQVRYDITVESTGLDLRQFGEQEYHIIRSVTPMTKYAVMVSDAKMIKYHLAKAIETAVSGRRGPVWIDVPLNIQGQMIETDELIEYAPVPSYLPSDDEIEKIVNEIKLSKRPVIIAGSALRTSGSLNMFTKLIKDTRIPVICPTSTVDYFTSGDEFYFGMFGTFGGRAGNFIVQNADLIVSFGARLSFKQIGFNFEQFSPESKKIVIDADPEELKKPTVHIDFPLCADAADIIRAMAGRDLSSDGDERKKWFEYCSFLKRRFSNEAMPERESISAYTFADTLLNTAGEDAIVILGNNTGAVSLLQSGIKKNGQRMYGNVNCGTMGYDLPAAVGAAVAASSPVILVTGEGSFQMNVQELQTVVHNELPIKIVIFNNNSYQAIVMTQTNFFNSEFAGCTNRSGISFPSFEKLAYCYGFPFKSISSNASIHEAVVWLLKQDGRAILELVQTEADPILPKLSSKKLDDGSMVSPHIDDLYPFLTKDEYELCQFDNFKGGQ